MLQQSLRIVGPPLGKLLFGDWRACAICVRGRFQEPPTAGHVGKQRASSRDSCKREMSNEATVVGVGLHVLVHTHNLPNRTRIDVKITSNDMCTHLSGNSTPTVCVDTSTHTILTRRAPHDSTNSLKHSEFLRLRANRMSEPCLILFAARSDLSSGRVSVIAIVTRLLLP